MDLLILYIVLFLFLIFLAFLFTRFMLDKLINKLLGIKKKVKIEDTPGKNIDRWGRVIIVIVFLFLFLIIKDASALKWVFGLYWITLLGFQACMEWKYINNSKQYLNTLIILIIFLVFLYNIENLFKLLFRGT